MLDTLLWSQFQLPLLVSSSFSAAAASVVAWRMRARRLSGVRQQFRSEQERWDLVFKASQDTGARYEAKFRLRSKEGEYRWFKSLGVPVRNAQGDITSWIGTCTEIDTQKRSEETLEAAVQSRTLQLADECDKAEAATRAKSEFLAFVQKPIRRVPLLRTVQAVLEGKTADEGNNGGEPSSATGGERSHVLLAEDNTVNQLVARCCSRSWDAGWIL